MEIKYTDRDYASLKQTLINRLSSLNPNWTNHAETDLGITLIEVMLYLTDNINFYIDKMVNESYVYTALQPRSLLNLARFVSWTPPNTEPSITTMQIAVKNIHNKAVIVPAGLSCSATVSGKTINFYTLNEGVIPAGHTSINLKAIQGVKKSVTIIASGLREYKISSSQNVSSNYKYISVFVDGIKWDYVESFKDSFPTSRHYTLAISEDRNVFVIFGDGKYGRLPAIDAIIEVIYNENEGKEGNIPKSLITVANVTLKDVDDEDVQCSVSAIEAASGGMDYPDTNYLRYMIASLYRMQDRAITKDDLEAIVIRTGLVRQCKVFDVRDSRDIGYYMARMYVIVDGGLTETVKTAISDTIKRYKYVTLWYDIREAIYVDINLDIKVKIFSAYEFESVKNDILSVLGQYFSFATAGSDEGLVIGQDIRYSNLVNLIENIKGVDYLELFINGVKQDKMINVGEVAQLNTVNITSY